MTSEHCGGVTLDLIKCFNQLPQAPCRELMMALGVPPIAVTIWYSSISAMTRWWVLQGGLHPAGLGTCGVPEGDPMSVVAMLCVNNLWTFLLDRPSMTTNAFADNWAYATSAPRDHRMAVLQTLRLTRALKVSIDFDKTWCWSTNDEHKKVLQQVANELLPAGQGLQAVLHARELGYITHYRRVQFRGTQQERHTVRLKRLRKLQKQGFDLTTAAQIARQSRIHKALFGAHLYLPGKKFFRGLRSAIS